MMDIFLMCTISSAQVFYVKPNFKACLFNKLFYLSPPSVVKTHICAWEDLYIGPKMAKAQRAFLMGTITCPQLLS